MYAQIATGLTLVALTWLLCGILIMAYGRWIAVLLSPRDRNFPDFGWRSSLWWGIAGVTTTALLLHFWLPLGSPIAGWTVALVGFGLLLLSLAWQTFARPHWPRPSVPVLLWVAVVALTIAYLAAKALGPVTNYDSGLYHLGSIKYAFDYSVIPGLANLYFPFGYANAQFPLAALLGNGPWDGIGYRLLNGTFLLLAIADVTSRMLNKRWTWGTFVLIFGLSATLIPITAMADDMLISPTSDTSVMLLTIVSAAYLADAVQGKTLAGSPATIAVLLSALSVVFRPTMVLFAASTLAIAIFFHNRKRTTSRSEWIAVGSYVFLFAGVTVLRDRVLSGWLSYPLSVLPLPVAWQAPDPTRWRIGTLAAARNPETVDGFVTAHSWDWLGAWIGRLSEQWEPWFFLVGLIFAAFAVSAAARAGVMRQQWGRLVAIATPSFLAVTGWFLLSPPSFRFIWGPLFCLILLPIGTAFGQLAASGRASCMQRNCLNLVFISGAACIGFVTLFSVIERNQFDTITEFRSWKAGPLEIPYAITPIQIPETTVIPITNNLSVLTPRVGDQCWDSYPLCTYYTGQVLRLRGNSLQDGFTQ